MTNLCVFTIPPRGPLPKLVTRPVNVTKNGLRTWGRGTPVYTLENSSPSGPEGWKKKCNHSQMAFLICMNGNVKMNLRNIIKAIFDQSREQVDHMELLSWSGETHQPRHPHFAKRQRGEIFPFVSHPE